MLPSTKCLCLERNTLRTCVAKHKMFSKLHKYQCLHTRKCTETPGRLWNGCQLLGHLARQMVYEENRKILYKHGKSSFSMTFTITKENHPLFHLGAIQYDHTSGRYDNKKYTLDDVDMCQNMHGGPCIVCQVLDTPLWAWTVKFW